MDTRQILRKKLRQCRAKITLSYQKLASQKIAQRLIEFPLFKKSRRIAGYVAINMEIDPQLIIKIAWENHKECYLPVLQKKKIFFSIYKEHMRLVKNHFNIPEPLLSKESRIDPCFLDIVLVPLLGFTINGQRLGMGGGFYDRCFNFLLDSNPRPTKPYLIGLAYETQKLESFETSVWDVPLNGILTEEKMYLNKQL